MEKQKGGIYRRFLKRPMDFILSLIAIIILSPLLVVIAILVKTKLGSPILFKQRRPGKNEKIFTMYKFRTMTDEKDLNGNLLPDNERLTKFGKFLRSTSLDELPELFNILKGDMSIVGPRPQLIKDMVFMSRLQRERHKILPGLTGLAQVNGRNNISWEEKLELDIKYLRQISFIGDCIVIIKTCIKVAQKNGVNTEGMETAEDYGDYLLRTGKISSELYKEQLNKSRKIAN